MDRIDALMTDVLSDVVYNGGNYYNAAYIVKQDDTLLTEKDFPFEGDEAIEPRMIRALKAGYRIKICPVEDDAAYLEYKPFRNVVEKYADKIEGDGYDFLVANGIFQTAIWGDIIYG